MWTPKCVWKMCKHRLTKHTLVLSLCTFSHACELHQKNVSSKPVPLANISTCWCNHWHLFPHSSNMHYGGIKCHLFNSKLTLITPRPCSVEHTTHAQTTYLLARNAHTIVRAHNRAQLFAYGSPSKKTKITHNTASNNWVEILVQPVVQLHACGHGDSPGGCMPQTKHVRVGSGDEDQAAGSPLFMDPV